MLWQDWVISIGQLGLVAALIPTIRGKDKPALLTSIVTGLILATFAFTFFTLSLWTSSVTSIISAASWFLLAFQKYRQKK